MTVVAETPDAPPEDHAPVGVVHHAHPGDREYWVVGLVLAVLTGLEVSTYWFPEDWHQYVNVSLIIMMVIKFVLVALFFMHLKFDPKVLKRIFFFGLFLAMAVYLAMLSTFVFWDGSGDVEDTFPDPPRDVQAPPPPAAS